MKNNFWVNRYNQKIIPVADSFTGKDRELAIEAFKCTPENINLWDRLEETKTHLPWARSLISSLQKQVIVKGHLSDKQRSLATSLYLDACMTSDDKVKEQQDARKLGYRLMQLELGKVQELVNDIMLRTDTRPFSFGQIRAFQNIAKRQHQKLSEVPKLVDGETFDGWLIISKPIKVVDNNDGL